MLSRMFPTPPSLRDFRGRLLLLSLPFALSVGACTATDEPVDPMIEGGDFPLSEVDPIYEGAPGNDELPIEGKADQVLPAQFDLVSMQTPVKSQGRRGVCSIFATIALMEHLYLVEGTIGMPDFSEQFLQWSTKVELGRFRNTSGSNSSTNLRALNRFGGVLEEAWPYETNAWGTSDDEACTGDDQPVRCYTNGEPPEDAMIAQRFHLPRGRWINSRARSIKSHMLNTNTAVQVGGDFFYQAWNHRKSNLPRGTEFSRYRDQGYVLPPNAEDRRDSSGDRRAGHSFVLVGWDDDLEVQAVGGDGELLNDADGNPVMVKGFFLFKNSWGTTWATSNPFGAGYGWIAYDYVRSLTAYASAKPEVMLNEVCGDGRDNDFNGATDCADAACAMDRSCVDPAGSYTNDTPVSIPDNDPMGVTSTIEVMDSGMVSGLSVEVDIEHTYIGDLELTLTKGDRSVILVSREGAGADNLQRTFDVADFDGVDAAGIWTLHISDNARVDEGTLRSWKLNITRCADGDCAGMPEVSSYSNETLAVIPDNDPAGATRAIEVSDSGNIAAARVTVNISHPVISELVVRLEKDGTTVELLRSEPTSGGMFMRTFTVGDFNGTDSQGTWSLTVVDTAALDVGTLNGWSLELTR